MAPILVDEPISEHAPTEIDPKHALLTKTGARLDTASLQEVAVLQLSQELPKDVDGLGLSLLDKTLIRLQLRQYRQTLIATGYGSLRLLLNETESLAMAECINMQPEHLAIWRANFHKVARQIINDRYWIQSAQQNEPNSAVDATQNDRPERGGAPRDESLQNKPEAIGNATQDDPKHRRHETSDSDTMQDEPTQNRYKIGVYKMQPGLGSREADDRELLLKTAKLKI